MTKLMLRMAPSSVPTVLREWDEHDDRFDVVLDESLSEYEHLVQFMTEDEWQKGAINLDPHRMENVERWVNFNGRAMDEADLEDMHIDVNGGNSFCLRYPYACVDHP